MKCPPSLNAGDRISVVAPSGPFDDELLRLGLAKMAGYDVHVPDSLWGRREGFFAGEERSRLTELQTAFDDPLAKAVLVARGGYGLAPLLPKLDLSRLSTHPKWFIGFSDATALHSALNAQGIASIHAPNGTTLARASHAEVAELFGLLAGTEIQTFSALRSLVEGAATGPLFGGNLTVLFAEAAAGRLSFPEGSVLFLEDVTETSYRVDRMLTALRDGGHFEKLAGVLLGEFVDCSAGKFGVPTADVLVNNFSRLNIPVVAGFPAGHGVRNRPFLLGAQACISQNGSEVILTRSGASTQKAPPI